MDLKQLLGIEWPIVQAPMAGGFGSLPCAMLVAAWRAALAPCHAEFADALAEFEPPVLSLHFGLPSAELLRRATRWGVEMPSSATAVDEARWLEARGVDAALALGAGLRPER